MEYDKIYYQAYKLKDAKFDGVFFIGVISTGIYCRPVCTARMPKKKNCQFFSTAVAAQNKGFRACRRCRPELAPGFSNIDMPLFLAKNAKILIEQWGLINFTIEQLAERLGITSRHLRRIFNANFGISPSKFVQEKRLIQAKLLLEDINLTVMQVALQVGFSSVRQFNTSFKRYYHINPTQFRRSKSLKSKCDIISIQEVCT